MKYKKDLNDVVYVIDLFVQCFNDSCTCLKNRIFDMYVLFSYNIPNNGLDGLGMLSG